jgi:hypothetical protein
MVNLPEGSTQNLMDYSAGTELFKYQWDFIHNPEGGWFLWEDVEEGAYVDTKYLVWDASDKGVALDLNKLICITPAGVPISIADEIQSLNFATRFTDMVPYGTLTGFTNSLGNYVAYYDSEKQLFKGYVKLIKPEETDPKKRYLDVNGQLVYYKETATVSASNDADVLLGFRKNCAIEFRFGKLSSFSKSGKSENSGEGKIRGMNDFLSVESRPFTTKTDNDACFSGKAKEFYDAYLNAGSAYQAQLLEITKLILEAGDELFADYEKYAGGSHKYYNMDLWGTPDDYQLFATALRNYLENKQALEEAILKSTDRDRIAKLGWLLLQEKYARSISYPVRLHMLKHISNGAMHGNRLFGNSLEFMALRLIETVPNLDDAYLLLGDIKEEKLLANLYRRVDDSFGPDNFTRLIVTLCHYALRNNTAPPNDANIFVWDDSFINRSDINYKLSFQDDGNLRISVFNTEYVYHSYGYSAVRVLDSQRSQADVDPFTLVPVMFRGESQYLPRLGQQAGAAENILFVPAIYLMALQAKHVTAIAEATVYTTINVGSIFLGVGAVANAGRLIKIIVWAESAISAADVAVIWLENDIKKLNGGDEFLRGWAMFNVAVGVASFTGENIIKAASQNADNFTDFVYGWDKLKRNYRNNPEQLIDAIGPENFRKIEDQARAVSGVEGAGVNRATDLDATFTDDLINSKISAKRNSQLSEFARKSPSEKISEITNIWNTKYPLQEMFEGRTLFEDIMRQYRYTSASGWAHTAEISEYFKGVDFYKGASQGNQIFAETAVSMKTTISTNVDSWLASKAVQKNINFLKEGLDPVTGLASNNKIMFITNAEIHIYMPKANITDALNTTWMNKLNTVDPKIMFEIKSIEDFIP